METVPESPSRSHNALLIIDVQVGLVELIHAEIQAGVLSRIETLLSRAHASETPVIYIQHDGPKGHPLETHTKGWEIHPSIKPLESESVVRKRESDSFFETTLQEELKKRGIKHLVIAGGMTEYCVDTTCRLTRDNGVLTAANIIAHHNFVLDDFGAGDHVIKAKPTDQIVF